MAKLPFTNEIACSMLSSNVEEIETLKADPKSYLLSCLNFEVSANIDLLVAENNERDVHLSLPYYSGMVSSVGRIDDSSLGDFSGGVTQIGGLTIYGSGEEDMIRREKEKALKNNQDGK